MATLRDTRLMIALLVIVSFCAMACRAEPIDFSGVDPAEHTLENWYLDTVDGQAAGYWYNKMTVEDGRITSVYHSHRVESHGGERSTHTQRITWTETQDFQPLRIVVVTEAGSDTITKTYRFTDDGIELTSEQDGRSIRRRLQPVKGDYLTAAQEAIAVDLYLERGVEAFDLNTLDLSIGLKPFVTTYRRSDATAEGFKLDNGNEIKAQLWKTTYSIVPGFEMKTWIGDTNNIVGMAYDIDEMAFVSRLSDASVAQRQFDPPEMSGLSVVVPDRPIERIRQQRKIVYELSYRAGDDPIVPVSAGHQTVQCLGRGKARVTIDLDAKPQTNQHDHPTDAHLANSIMIDHEDEAVRELGRKAIAKLPDDASSAAIAKACKRYVSVHLTGASLAVGDATASEAARTRSGDCTESAVLLAALLRVHGIPSRCVSGLVYSEDDFAGQKDVFVYHLWTQAWIDSQDGSGYWLDLDAAMWRYAAGHIALGVSAMGDDDQQDLIQLVPMQQKLQIKVKETFTKNQR